ncbi:MAG: DUF4363 family protein [Oscillospiraceae bacterium]|nr:DUF4363 family protein [Oscillospiraceae bacterium]
MKRVVFAVFLLVFLIGFNFFCLGKINESKETTITNLSFILSSIDAGDSEKILSECKNFAVFWEEEHGFLGMIVRHELLDQITASAAKLFPLAKHEEYGELSSEVCRCIVLIEEIWDSERPVLRNIL